MSEIVNKDLMEINKEYLTALLRARQFYACTIIIDIIMYNINKQNYEEHLNMLKEAIINGRKERLMEDKTTNFISKINFERTQTSEDADYEAKLIVYIAQSIYNKLELDNLYLNQSEEEIEDINSALDTFVNGTALGNWLYEDNLDWREKNVKKIN